MEFAIRQIDEFGRISLPAKWRRDLFSDTRTVLLIRREDSIVLKPVREVDLTKYFDSLDLGVDEIEDWREFERKIHARERD